MGNISTNFSFSEFDCRDGSEMPECVKENIRELVETILQPLRNHFGRTIKINSGYRSPTYNRSIRGAKKSQHMLGRAADITVNGHSPGAVAFRIQEMFDPPGLGRYKTFTHVDIRKGRKSRWGSN